MPLPPAPPHRAAQLPPQAFAAAAAAKPAPKAVRQAGRGQAQVPGVAVPPAEKPGAVKAAAKPTQKAAASTAAGKKANQHTSQATAPQTAGGVKKLFVLDTNVLLHDPSSLFRFAEHDVFVPLVVLEELDAHKRGTTEVARNARQVSRSLEALLTAAPADLAQGLALSATGQRAARGMLRLQTAALAAELAPGLLQGKNDTQILAAVAALRQSVADRAVVLVSKDINMRVKARVLGLSAEDYQNDKVLDDGELLYSGALALPPDFWATAGRDVQSWSEGASTCYRIGGAVAARLLRNQFVYYEAAGEVPLHLRVSDIAQGTATLKTLKDFSHPKHAVWGVNARNREQNFALNLLMDPDIDLVTLTGTAGTGKTLLALAAALSQVLDERRYSEIIMTRATVSVGEDIGFLPGTEEEKMGPWMGALDDNLEFLARGGMGSAGEWGRAASNDLIRNRIKIKSMSFMRGRTFLDKYVIIDEAQNLTPKQIKTLVTRAGPGSKLVCLGNLVQIDTPYLTEGASGLSWLVDRFKGWQHSGHISLARGERSRLADFASEVL